MVTRSVMRPARRGPLGAGRAVRAGLALAAMGIAVVGATGGTAFAGLGQLNLPSPDGGAPVRTHGVRAADGDRHANDRTVGRVPAQAKAKPPAKPPATTKAKKAKAKAKARANAVAAQRNRVAHKNPAKTKAAWKAPLKAPPAGTVTIAAAPPAAAPVTVAAPAAPTAVTVELTGTATPVLTVSWTVDVSATGIVDHFVATALEDRTKTCRTRTNAATSCAVTAPEQGATYTFTVRAIGVPGAGDSDPSTASAPATVTGLTDGLLVTPGSATHDTVHITLGSLKVAPRVADKTRHIAKAADKVQDKGRGTGGSASTSEQASGKVFGGQLGGQLGGGGMGLPHGAATAPAAAAPAVADGDRHTRTGTLVMLGLGALAAAFTAYGVTRGRRRHPLTG